MSEEVRKQYIRIAEELHYSDRVINKIRVAKTEYEINRILKRARLESKD